MKKTYLLSFLLLIIPMGLLQAQLAHPECLVSPYNTQITIVGDSRSEIIATAPTSETILNARIGNTQIIDRSHLNAIQNLGWSGSKVKPKFHILPQFMPGVDTNNWIWRINECAYGDGTPYRNTDKTILQVGGNDILDFYGQLENVEAIYLLWEAIKNPYEALYNYLTGKTSAKVELFWFWQMEAEGNRVSNGTEAVADYFLSNLPLFGEPNKLLLISVAPAFNSDVWYYGKTPFTWKKAYRLTTYFGRLQIKYATEVYPRLFKKYGIAVQFMDMFYPYLHNVLYDHATYYIDGVNFPDGIHFSVEGNKKFGEMLVTKMVSLGWFPINPDLANIVPANLDPKFQSVNMQINMKALTSGVDLNLLTSTPFETITNSDGVVLGYRKVFGGIHIYLKENGEAFAIRGATLQGFENEGGVNSYLGFPTSDTHSSGIAGTIERTLFECGFITHNTLNLLDRGNYGVGGQNACPGLSETQKISEPDFIGCSEDAKCGSRWFEDFLFQLQPISGYPPFRFEFIEDSGNVPGSVDKSGRIIGGPTNNLNGSWQFKVRMIDRDLRTVEKYVYITSGL
jgi:lysophospholipase L1-like esterase